MKKLVIMLVVVAAVVLVSIWWRASRRGPEIERAPLSAQQEPVAAVEYFMNTCVQMVKAVWRDVDAKEGKASVRREGESTEELVKRLGIKDPKPLFKDPQYGNLALVVLCFSRFDSFAVTGSDIGEDQADVTVEFTPGDVLGIKKIAAERGVPVEQKPPQPISVPFRLVKENNVWFITEIRGKTGKAIRSMEQLSKRRRKQS